MTSASRTAALFEANKRGGHLSGSVINGGDRLKVGPALALSSKQRYVAYGTYGGDYSRCQQA